MRQNLFALAPQFDRDRQYAQVVKMVESVVANNRAQQSDSFAESQSR